VGALVFKKVKSGNAMRIRNNFDIETNQYDLFTIIVGIVIIVLIFKGDLDKAVEILKYFIICRSSIKPPFKRKRKDFYKSY